MTSTLPVVGRSRAPIRWRRVVLPDPDGPTMARSSPWWMVKLTPAKPRRRLRVDLGHPFELQDQRGGTVSDEGARPRAGEKPRDRPRQRAGHTFGTTTRWPTCTSDPLTCTIPSASSNWPTVTASR